MRGKGRRGRGRGREGDQGRGKGMRIGNRVEPAAYHACLQTRGGDFWGAEAPPPPPPQWE